MSFIFLMLSLLFSLILISIISKRQPHTQRQVLQIPLLCQREALWSLHFIWFPEMKWINMWRKKESVLWNRNTDFTNQGIITEETCIKFWIHAISLDARVVIRPTEHTGAIWVLQSCKDKPWEQGHIDLPSTKSLQTFVIRKCCSSLLISYFPFWRKEYCDQ